MPPLIAHEAQRHFDAGVQALRQGKHAAAITQLQQAVASYPGYAEGHYMLGRSYNFV